MENGVTKTKRGFWTWEVWVATVSSKWVPRGDCRDNSILSEQIYPSAKPFRETDRRKAPTGVRVDVHVAGPW